MLRKTYLLTADQFVIDFVLEQLSPSIVLTGPTPDILPLGTVPASLHNSGSDSPNYDGKDESNNGNHSPVNSNLLRSLMSATPVSVHDIQRNEERQDSNAENGDLWPLWCRDGPRWEVVARSQVLGGIEYNKCGYKEGKDDSAANTLVNQIFGAREQKTDLQAQLRPRRIIFASLTLSLTAKSFLSYDWTF